MYASGYMDVDVALTTRELARMIKQSGIDFLNLPDGEPDIILGDYTGAGTIFGATGGVMEAALRTAHFLVTGQREVEVVKPRGPAGREGRRDRRSTARRSASPSPTAWPTSRRC